MASSRHKHAVPKRAGLSRPNRTSSPTSHHAARRKATPVVSPWRRSAAKFALPAVGVLALVGTSAVVVAQDAQVQPVAASAAVSDQDLIARALESADGDVSRDGERPELPAEISMDVTGTLVALEDDTDVLADADGESGVLATLDKGDKVDVTGEADGEWTKVVHKELPRWVATDALAEKLPEPKPEPEPEAEPEPEPALSGEPCPVGTEVGLQPDTIKVLRAVCAEFPQVTSYGGFANRGEHATGRSLDIMLDPATGDAVAAFLQENRAELGVEYLIFQQRIWNPSTSSGWRGMSDRGGATANHMDHVHVTTYGSAATD